MNKEQSINAAILEVKNNQHDIKLFMDGVTQWFSTHPKLSNTNSPTIHSVKSRLKDTEHLREKITRKWKKNGVINSKNIFSQVTDLAGIRVMHLHQEQFRSIHEEIQKKVDAKDWHLFEAPKAYTWDPESQVFFEEIGIAVEVKPSFYTSVHYVIQPKENSTLCCEIQVRTLFEEIWGEVEHTLNYPADSANLACREQLRVLAKLVGAGSRLVDSLFRSAKDSASVQVKQPVRKRGRSPSDRA
jgi:putative GTP pyrophosphokinase